MKMTGMERSAVVATFVKECRQRNAFCGETLVQKSIFFMQELFRVPLDFDYQLYIYGPFSFELQGHLASMHADDMLAVRSLDYGTTFEPGNQIAFLEARHSEMIKTHRKAIDFTVEHLSGRGVKQLERIATALYFTVTTDDGSIDGRAAKIREVKRHISDEEARKAVEEIDRWRREIAA